MPLACFELRQKVWIRCTQKLNEQIMTTQPSGGGSMLQSGVTTPAVPDGSRGHGTCRDTFAKLPKKTLGQECPGTASRQPLV